MRHSNDNDRFNFMAALYAVRDHKLATEKMHQIEDMLQASKDHVETYCRQHRDAWIEEEMVTHASKIIGHELQQDDLYGRTDIDIAACKQYAESLVAQRVDHDIQEAITPFREDQKFLVNSVAGKRDMLHMDVHVINQSFRKQYAANKERFDAEKPDRLYAAALLGSENPERDVYLAYREEQTNLETTRQTLVATLHDDYGFTHEPTLSLSQSFSRSR